MFILGVKRGESRNECHWKMLPGYCRSLWIRAFNPVPEIAVNAIQQRYVGLNIRV